MAVESGIASSTNPVRSTCPWSRISTKVLISRLHSTCLRGVARFGVMSEAFGVWQEGDATHGQAAAVAGGLFPDGSPSHNSASAGEGGVGGAEVAFHQGSGAGLVTMGDGVDDEAVVLEASVEFFGGVVLE